MILAKLLFVLLSTFSFGSCFVPASFSIRPASNTKSFLDDFFGGSSNSTASDEKTETQQEEEQQQEEESMSVSAFQAERNKRTLEEEEFDGYALRDVILEKWGHCFDMDFQRVDAYGMRKLYLNVLPFRLGARRFRHETGEWIFLFSRFFPYLEAKLQHTHLKSGFPHFETEMDYLCHLQAIVEILEKYNQLDYVLYQIAETNKKPRAGTSPLVAVPLRLDLTPEQAKSIMG